MVRPRREPITVTSYGDGRAVIETRSQPLRPGVDIYDAGGFRISNLEVEGAGALTATNGTLSTTGGVQFYNDLPGNVQLNYIRIDNVEASGYKDGISIGGFNGTSGYTNVQVTNSNVHHNRDTGLILYGPNFNAETRNYVHHDVEVKGVVAHHNEGNPNNTTVSSGNGIALGSVNGGLVTNSEAYENGTKCKTAFGPIGIWTYDSNNITIENNVSHHNRTGGKADGGGFDLDHNTSNSVMQYNYSHNNEGSGYLMYSNKLNQVFENNTIRFNISHNDGKKNGYAGIRFGGRIYRSNVYHNTVYIGATTSGPPIAFRSNGVTGGAVTVRNNIFYMGVAGNIVQAKGLPKKLKLESNDYYAPTGLKFRWGTTTYSSLNAWSNATSQEKVGNTIVGRTHNPLLVQPGGQNDDSYRLQAGSPMIDAALAHVSIASSQDYFGNPTPRDDPASVGSGRDIGAHEF